MKFLLYAIWLNIEPVNLKNCAEASSALALLDFLYPYRTYAVPTLGWKCLNIMIPSILTGTQMDCSALVVSSYCC